MSEASIATSVPVPIAMPRSAWASAGASLTPSPTIATTRPSACRRSTTPAFSAGSTSAMTSSTPIRAATARAVAALSPVSRIVRRPERAQPPRRPRASVGLTRRRRRTAPAPRRPSSAAIAVRPSASAAARARSSSGGSASDGSALASSAGPPGDDRAARDRALHAEPGAAGEVLDLRRAPASSCSRGGGDRAADRVLGAVLQRADEPQRLRLADALGDADAVERSSARSSRCRSCR